MPRAFWLEGTIHVVWSAERSPGRPVVLVEGKVNVTVLRMNNLALTPVFK